MGEVVKVLIVAAVIYGLWQYGRRFAGMAANPRARAAAAREGIEDMAPCGTCGTFMTASAARCARPDCPRALRQ